MLECRNSEGGKGQPEATLTGSDGMAGTFRRVFFLYYAVAFVVLIPATTYEVLKEQWPKTILLICIPAYALLSWSFYKMFKATEEGKRKP